MKVEVLGNTQDGGVPHLGCECETCTRVREGEEDPRYVNSLLLREDGSDDSVRYLISATPDIRYQIVGDYIDGVFVSDNHIADTLGLLQFGPAILHTSNLPVYSTPEVEDWFHSNDPFRLLIDRENIQTRAMEPGEEVDIQGGTITPVEVEHWGDTRTLGFMIEGEEKKLFYFTHHDEWTESTRKKVREADIAIVDGTFWEENEVEREGALHPPVQETIEIFDDADTDIYFTHMNHTNPILRENSEERKEIEDRGFSIVEEGDEFDI